MTPASGTGAEGARPLSVTWREWIASTDWDGRRFDGDAFDAIVVGSGYGGSVAALRLAEKGYRVLLLERGSEYLPGEFPNDFSLVPKFFRINVPGRGSPLGRASGLVEVHLGQGMVAVTGNGLGGGSLVNAGVVIRPDDDVFHQPQWPVAIRRAGEQALGPFFDLARQGLGGSTWRSGLPDDSPLDKTAALGRMAARMGQRMKPLDLTVDTSRCTRCGDCASGCNEPGAKGSLESTYLARAAATGRVQMVTQAQVYRFERACAGDGSHAGWRVQVFATDAQHDFAATRELFADQQPSATWRHLEAPMLFVCAGTLGSTQLLQRSQSLAGDRLAFSPALGTRVSGNGDSVSWITDQEQRVGDIAQGQAGLDAWREAQRPAPDGKVDRSRIVGPTITAAIDLRQPSTDDGPAKPLQQRVLIQDCAIPRAIAPAFHELLATVRTLRQLDGWWFRRPGADAGAAEDPLAASERQAQHTQALLAMGHDGSPARLVWLEGLDSCAPYLLEPEKLGTYVEQQKIFDRWGVGHVHNPLWESLPRDAVKLMAGPKPPHTVTTVHPLGGCVMGDDPGCSVVNDVGQVWVADPGRGFLPGDAMLREAGSVTANAPARYRGLYVLDGAILPSSLGCNPLWTITALAERALSKVPDKPVAAAQREARRSDRRRPAIQPSRQVPVAAQLHEELQARDVRVAGALARYLGSRAAWGRLRATFHVADMQACMRSADHRAPATGELVLGGVGPDPNEVRVRYQIAEGWFTPLPANGGSAGPVPLLRAVAESAACLVAPWFLGAGLGAVLLLLLLAVALPFPRSFLTWLALRGWRDIRERGFSWEALRTSGPWIRALLKQLVHASEKRVMHYGMRLELRHPLGQGLPPTLELRASKRVSYRASLGQMLSRLLWLRRPCEANASELVPLRPTFWEQVMDAHVRIGTGGAWGWLRPQVRGCFRMGFDNLTSSGLSSARRNARGAMELGMTGDSTSGVLGLAGYPLLFLRFALKTRLLDFRLPTYSNLPVPDCAPACETELRIGAQRVPAQAYWLEVPRGSSSSDDGSESAASLRLQLWRYRRPGGQPELKTGTWMGEPVVRAKSVLLLHAFGQSGLSYTVKTIDQNLAERFWADGYEVWVLESRMSTRSGHAAEPSSIDQMAAFDVPCAVRRILEEIGNEQPAAAPLQISAFAQCIGSASLWMALLAGKLSHERPAAHAIDGHRPVLSMLSHAMFSQVHPWVVGARGTQSKTWMPALLQVLWRRGTVPFGVRGPQDSVLLSTLDRVLATLPAPRQENRRPGGKDDGAATCRRIRFIEAPLFQHRNIDDDTLAAMNQLFGEANLRLFGHARRFVDRERLVDEDGVNRYVTDDNIARNLCFPVQLLHGEANELFDAESARRSFGRLGALQGGWQQAFCREGEGPAQPLLVPGYGHLDVLIGKYADTEVYPGILRFFDRCLGEEHHRVPDQASRDWTARAPALGPFVGWLQPRTAGQPRNVLRVSFAVDEREGTSAPAPLPPVRVRYTRNDGRPGWIEDVRWTPYRLGRIGDRPETVGPALWQFAWGDIPLPDDLDTAHELLLLTLHETGFSGERLHRSPDPGVEALEDFLARARARARARRDTVVPPVSEPAGFDLTCASFRLPEEARATVDGTDRVRWAVASCRHPGLGVDCTRVEHTVTSFLQRHAQDPVALAMLLGDQIYADATAGLMDPWSPYERFCDRYALAFDRHGLGRLLAAMPVYMTPDDHEWTDGFPCGAPLLREHWAAGGARQGFGQRNERVIELADHATTAFQRLQSPPAGPRSYYSFRHGCGRFFVIDGRSGRDRNAPTLVGPEVFAALAQWLDDKDAAQALHVIACGTVVLPALRSNADPANPGVEDTWRYAMAQRKLLLDMLVTAVPGRFVLLAGDYHLSGAGLVRQGERTVGAAVLAPPLYAPMPYANATPEAVDVEERIPVLQDSHLTLSFGGQGAITRGSGVGVLQARRQGEGFALEYSRELRIWEQGGDSSACETLVLPGGPVHPVPKELLVLAGVPAEHV